MLLLQLAAVYLPALQTALDTVPWPQEWGVIAAVAPMVCAVKFTKHSNSEKLYDSDKDKKHITAARTNRYAFNRGKQGDIVRPDTATSADDTRRFVAIDGHNRDRFPAQYPA